MARDSPDLLESLLAKQRAQRQQVGGRLFVDGV